MALNYPQSPADVAPSTPLTPGPLASSLTDIGRLVGPPKNYQLADTFYENLEEKIKDREAALQADEELQLIYKDRGGEIITVTGIGYHNPSMILFAGRDHLNNEVTIVTHMANVELLVKTVPTSNPGTRRPIGFHGSSQTDTEN
jgi:hypothetical protein